MRSSCRRAAAPSRPAWRKAAPIWRSMPTRATTPPTSTIASPATCAWTIYCRRRACRSAPAACSGRRREIRRPGWCGAIIHPRVRIIVSCGSTSLQTELDAHGAVIRKPVTLRIIIIENDANEGLFQDALRQIAAEQDVVDELAVFAVLRAGRELRGAGDVGELRSGRDSVVELGIDVELAALRIARRALLDAEPAIEIAEHAESMTGVRFTFDPRFERRHLLREQIAIASRRGQRASRATRLEMHGHQPE